MKRKSSKSFNIAGPCVPSDHYMLPAVERIPTNIGRLISAKNYFVLHAPRQSGKTTSIMALVDKINEKGECYAIYCSVESLENIPNSFTSSPLITEKIIQYMLDSGIENLIDACDGISLFNSQKPDGLMDDGTISRKKKFITVSNSIKLPLQTVCKKLDKPLLIFIDEIDTLSGDVLISCLRQLRDGYIQRSKIPFPNSIALVGMRNIRDYKARIRPDSEALGTSSPFNIITEAFTLANFTRQDVQALYAQHTEETGQAFEDQAVEQAMFWTDGQPWLVNALAYNVIARQMGGDFTRPITGDHIDLAADSLKIDMNVHIDSLMARLQEPKVKRVMAPILTGSDFDGQVTPFEDRQYCLDIGLIKKLSGGRYSPANLIYGDVMVRQLTMEFQDSLPIELEGRFVGSKGPEISELLRDYQVFWGSNSDKMSNRFAYQECDAQFSLFGFMQKAFNGTVQLVKEFASGTGFVDVCASYKRHRYPIELKMKSHGYSRPASIKQLLAYMDRWQAREGWLVVFDRDSKKPWSKKITWETETLPNGIIIHVVGC